MQSESLSLTAECPDGHWERVRVSKLTAPADPPPLPDPLPHPLEPTPGQTGRPHARSTLKRPVNA